MRIDFNQLQTKNIEDPAVSAAPCKSGSSKGASRASDAFSINADGILFGHSEENILSRDRQKKKSVADQAAEASAMGVHNQMDQMLVVAQTMSPADAKALADEGYDMSAMDPADAVNSLDRMKVKLAAAGVNVAGYTDNVSADKVAEVTGQSMSSEALAADRAGIQPGGAAPALGAAGDLPAVPGDDIYFSAETTDPEIAKTLTAYDLPVNEDNMASVREAVNMASELQSLTDNTRLFLASESMEPTIANVFTAEFSAGRFHMGGNSRYVADPTGYVGRAGGIEPADISKSGGQTGFDPEFERQISEVIEQAGYESTPDMTADAVSMINAGIPLTKESFRIYEDTKRIDIRPIKKEVMEALASGGRGKDAYLISDYKNIRSERVAKEAALSMASEVNRKNIDRDLAIDTGYLERDVESLRIREKEAFDLLEATLSVKADILRAPAALTAGDGILDAFASMRSAADAGAAAVLSGEAMPTLREVHERASALTRDYERMDRTYEAVGTEVRADLGDNIKKAFANTDFNGILKGLGRESTPSNERALRIASYSHMEFTAENIDKISAADARLNTVLDKLTPARVLRLIRDNINPLEISVKELNDKLTAYEDAEEGPAGDFARYLVAVRDRGNITEDEATSYIGIYRLVNAINAGDHKAVGALVASGAEMSFSSLLSAVRTGQKSHVDQYIDGNFGGMDAAFSEKNSRIDQMIRAAFSPSGEGGYEEQGFYEEDARKFAEAAKAEAEIYRALEAADIPRSADNIIAYEQLLLQGGSGFAKELNASASDRSRDRIKKARDKTLDAMGEGDPDKLKEAYDEMVKAELIGALEGERLDIRALQTRDKVLSIKSALAEKDEYNVPVEFRGEIININLKLRHGENQNSVDIYFETEDFGSVHAGLRVTDGIRGVIQCERTAGDDYMRERLGNIKEAVGNVSGKNTDLSVGNMDIPDDPKAMDGGKEDSALLYRIAKTVLDTVLS